MTIPTPKIAAEDSLPTTESPLKATTKEIHVTKRIELSSPSKSSTALSTTKSLSWKDLSLPQEEIEEHGMTDIDIQSNHPNHSSTTTTTNNNNKTAELPKAFFCHQSQTLMKNPVVGPDGYSYESSVVQSLDSSTTNVRYYPNRALQLIMEETLAMRDSSLWTGWKFVQQSVSNGIHYMMSDAAAKEPLFRPLNDAYYCPITFSLMHQPMIDPEGTTYEQVAIENWIRVNQKSPISRTPLQVEQLYPNKSIQDLLQAMKEMDDEHMHPSIRKWKEERIPQATDVELGGALVAETPPTVVVFPYPTTQSEWELREAARQRAMYQFLGVFFASVCLFGFVFYGSLFFLLLFILTILVVFSKRPSHHPQPPQQHRPPQQQPGQSHPRPGM